MLQYFGCFEERRVTDKIVIMFEPGFCKRIGKTSLSKSALLGRLTFCAYLGYLFSNSPPPDPLLLPPILKSAPITGYAPRRRCQHLDRSFGQIVRNPKIITTRDF